MKKIALGLIASLILLPVICFAQVMPQPPASWIAFQKQEKAKRDAFFQELNADRQAFLNANPDVQTYFQQMQAANKAQHVAWLASHPRRTTITPTP